MSNVFKPYFKTADQLDPVVAWWNVQGVLEPDKNVVLANIYEPFYKENRQYALVGNFPSEETVNEVTKLVKLFEFLEEQRKVRPHVGPWSVKISTYGYKVDPFQNWVAIEDRTKRGIWIETDFNRHLAVFRDLGVIPNDETWAYPAWRYLVEDWIERGQVRQDFFRQPDTGIEIKRW